MESLPKQNSPCELCLLCKSSRSNCIPTTPSIPIPPKARAILFLGEAPGYHEDLASQHWVGHTGKLLTSFIEASHLSDYADIFYSNSVRCQPPRNSAPTGGQINTCSRVHLLPDLQLLLQEYSEVLIFCCGAISLKALSGSGKKGRSLTQAFNSQGESGSSFQALSSLTDAHRIKVFSTYHPAILFAGRKPALVHAVESHFTLVRRYLTGEFFPNTLKITPEFPTILPLDSCFPSLASIDIETYGILTGINQTVFHPIKSQQVDQVPFGKQIITVSIAYQPTPQTSTQTNPSQTNTSGGFTAPRTLIFEFQNPAHLKILRLWFAGFVRNKTTLIGQNIPFDLLYLMFNDPVISSYIDPRILKIDDTMLLSFLLYEQRPEHGLKELSTLFGIADYSKLTVTGKTGTALSSSDPQLHYYNCLDSAATLILYQELKVRIIKQFGPSSLKLTDSSSFMRNAVLWCTFEMSRCGLSFDIPYLKKQQTHYATLRQDCIEIWASTLNLPLEGKGSQLAKQNIFDSVISDYHLSDDPRIEKTKVKKSISTGATNVNIILPLLRPDDPRLPALQTYANFMKYDKLLGSYLDKLLDSPSKGIVLKQSPSIGICYPTWYPNPRSSDKDDNGNTGGTIQARFSCKDPAAQTFPPVIQEGICSRFQYGEVWGYDLSQIELRVAALLSNDPLMMQNYLTGMDLHEQTALSCIPGASKDSPDWNDQRQLGKKLNFLVLYKGGAEKFQQVAMLDLGLELSLPFCQQVITLFDQTHATLRSWQDGLFQFASRKGYLEVITGWSRTFATGKSAEKEINEICNFPVQTFAAQLMQSAQYAIHCELRQQNCKSYINLQVHDAVYLDTHPSEREISHKICEKHLTNPPLLTIISNSLNRTIPILYARKHLAK